MEYLLKTGCYLIKRSVTGIETTGGIQRIKQFNQVCFLGCPLQAWLRRGMFSKWANVCIWFSKKLFFYPFNLFVY
jgi:hypothetical protein